MAKAESQTIGVPLNPLMKEETRVYVDQQKRADYLKNISQYLFWGATSIAGALVIGLLTGGLGVAGLPAVAVGSIGAIASVATFLGSVHFSNRATELSEKSAVLYSDIDSQNQAHRMVQAFAKAQSVDAGHGAQAEVPFEAPQRSWVEKTGKPAQGEHAHGGWAERIAAQAHAEDAHALAELKGRSI